MDILKLFLSIAQILTGIVAAVSLFFSIYAYRKQKIDDQIKIASNVSSWNINELPTNKQVKTNHIASVGDGLNDPNCTNIILNSNPFPVYNSILVFIPNSSNLQGTEALSNSRQHLYREVLTPGQTVTTFVNDNTPGNGHLVPELYFTDNNNIQWHRSKNGALKKTPYIETATELGIILKHL